MSPEVEEAPPSEKDHERGGLSGDDAHVVAQQPERRQHLSAGGQRVGQQQQTSHATEGYGRGPAAAEQDTW